MYAEVDIQTAPIFEGSTPTYEFSLVTEAGAAVQLDQLTALTLTYYDYPGLTVLNTRQAQDVLNAHDVTVSLTGVVTWALQPADTTRAVATTPCATHEACFTFTYDDNGAVRTQSHKAWFFIVPAARVAPLEP